MNITQEQLEELAELAEQAGNAYYWRFDGLSHSTPPIARTL